VPGAVALVNLNATQLLALACFGLLIGRWLKKKLPVLDHLNIPAAIVGGLVYASVALILRDRLVNFVIEPREMILQNVLMIAFFTTIGMSASFGLLKRGGPQVLWFFLIATVGAVLQNAVGIGAARAFGIDPLLGIVAGSVSLTGGPATAISFGKTFEALGVTGATTLGVASAMFGITAGGLVGGFIGGSLIRRWNLLTRPRVAGVAAGAGAAAAEELIYEGDPATPEPSRIADESESEESVLLNNVIMIAIAMGIGTLISGWFEANRIILPAYVGAMIAAAAMRNLDDRFGFAKISQHHVDMVGNIALSIFIVMALLTLRLWELIHLALPMIVMLMLQIALVWIMCLATFRLMGKDYEAAVMAGGFCGFMLGTTANSMACMSVLTEKYGPAPRAFIVVPIVGASLIDFTNAAIITQFVNLLR
jgi:glutamate:Na+ symporter, ESS family